MTKKAIIQAAKEIKAFYEQGDPVWEIDDDGIEDADADENAEVVEQNLL